MVKKFAVALVVAGSLVVTTAGAADAVAAPSCANSSATLARLQARETKVTSELAALAAKKAHGPWSTKRTAALSRLEASLAAKIAALEARCSSTGGGGSGGGGGGGGIS